MADMILIILILAIAPIAAAATLGIVGAAQLVQIHRPSRLRLVDRFVLRRRWLGAVTWIMLLAIAATVLIGSLGEVEMLGAGLALSAALGALIWASRASERDLLDRLRASGGALCPTCGYRIDGIDASRCPECGRLVTPEGAAQSWRDRLGEVGETIDAP